METSIWGYIVIVFAILLITIFLFKNKICNFSTSYSENFNGLNEGFAQNEKFVLKRDDNIYDDFYASTYDRIHMPHRRVPYEIKTIIDTTQADENNSIFLDVGSGTGTVVKELNDLGYTAFGIDKSEAMVKYCEHKSRNFHSHAAKIYSSSSLHSNETIDNSEKYEKSVFKYGDVEDLLLFNRSIFTHILCLYFTIYNFKNKGIFFRNCYQWLKPGGYLIIHLVDKDKFDTVPPVGNNPLFGSPQKNSKTRITSHSVDLHNFKYKMSYEFNKNNALLVETFEDSVTKNIRQNETTLYMENIDHILNLAKTTGFVPNASVSYEENGRHSFKPFGLEDVTGDPHQYLYILERPVS